MLCDGRQPTEAYTRRALPVCLIAIFPVATASKLGAPSHATCHKSDQGRRGTRNVQAYGNSDVAVIARSEATWQSRVAACGRTRATKAKAAACRCSPGYSRAAAQPGTAAKRGTGRENHDARVSGSPGFRPVGPLPGLPKPGRLCAVVAPVIAAQRRPLSCILRCAWMHKWCGRHGRRKHPLAPNSPFQVRAPTRENAARSTGRRPTAGVTLVKLGVHGKYAKLQRPVSR